jgi:hypothetical protein
MPTTATRRAGFLDASLRDGATLDDNAGYLAQWQAEVRVVAEESARRHTWILSLIRILHYCEAAGLFDCNKPFCPVATASRQYDSDDACAIYTRRRPEEWIGGRPRVTLLRTLVQPNEIDRADCHVMVRRRHVNAAALNARAVSSVLGRKWPSYGKEGRKLARTRGVGVKHDEERGLQAGRQDRDNTANGLDASPRSSNDHNVSRGSCQAYRRAFSIARLNADHPVRPLLPRHSRGGRRTDHRLGRLIMAKRSGQGSGAATALRCTLPWRGNPAGPRKPSAFVRVKRMRTCEKNRRLGAEIFAGLVR